MTEAAQLSPVEVAFHAVRDDDQEAICDLMKRVSGRVQWQDFRYLPYDVFHILKLLCVMDLFASYKDEEACRRLGIEPENLGPMRKSKEYRKLCEALREALNAECDATPLTMGEHLARVEVQHEAFENIRRLAKHGDGRVAVQAAKLLAERQAPVARPAGWEGGRVFVIDAGLFRSYQETREKLVGQNLLEAGVDLDQEMEVEDG